MSEDGSRQEGEEMRIKAGVEEKRGVEEDDGGAGV